MKYVLFSLLLIMSTVVNATSYLMLQWSDSARIVLTKESCLVSKLSGFRASLQLINGNYMKGCWHYVDNDQHIRIDWNNPNNPGDFAVRPIEEFKFVDQ